VVTFGLQFEAERRSPSGSFTEFDFHHWTTGDSPLEVTAMGRTLTAV
jgi:hypothetical protein